MQFVHGWRELLGAAAASGGDYFGGSGSSFRGQRGSLLLLATMPMQVMVHQITNNSMISQSVPPEGIRRAVEFESVRNWQESADQRIRHSHDVHGVHGKALHQSWEQARLRCHT